MRERGEKKHMTYLNILLANRNKWKTHTHTPESKIYFLNYIYVLTCTVPSGRKLNRAQDLQNENHDGTE